MTDVVHAFTDNAANRQCRQHMAAVVSAAAMRPGFLQQDFDMSRLTTASDSTDIMTLAATSRFDADEITQILPHSLAWHLLLFAGIKKWV